MEPLTWGYDKSVPPRAKAEIDADEKSISTRLDDLRRQRDAINREMNQLEWRFLHLGIEESYRARAEKRA